LRWLRNLIIIIFIVVCLWGVKRYTNASGYIEDAVIFATFPIEIAVVKVKDSVSDWIKKYILLVKLENNVEKMEREIVRLKVENYAYRMSNSYLRQALNMKTKGNEAGLHVFVCKVLGKSLINPCFLAIKPIENVDIDITKDYLVVSKDLVLAGRIHSFKEGVYLVSTLWNKDFVTDALVGEYRGVFYGGRKCCVKYISEDASLKKGMEVSSSAGFVLGKITRVEDKGFYKVAYVKPDFNLSERLALVVKSEW